MAVKRTRKARAARKRKRRMDRVEHDLTPVQWTALREAWGGCAYCGVADKPLQKDCVLALSRGGRYTLDNIVPACRSCNTSKCNDEVTTWLRRKRLDERTFLQRHIDIRGALLARSRLVGEDLGGVVFEGGAEVGLVGGGEAVGGEADREDAVGEGERQG